MENTDMSQIVTIWLKYPIILVKEPSSCQFLVQLILITKYKVSVFIYIQPEQYRALNNYHITLLGPEDANSSLSFMAI